MSGMTVNDRAHAIGTFRYVAVRLMEMVARWTPTTPEMEVKILFGRHIWNFAQQADALGKRTFELRQPEQYSRTPVEAYVALLDEVSNLESTSERLGALYDGLLPAIEQRYRTYIAAADPILDEPSILIMRRILGEIEGQREEARTVRQEMSIGDWNAATIDSAERGIERIVA